MQLTEPSAFSILGWVARAKGIAAKSYHGAGDEFLAANRAPEKARAIFNKAAVGAGTTLDGELTDYGISLGQWSDALRTRSAFYRMLSDNGFTRVPVRTRIGISTAPATAAVVPEGEAVPLSKLTIQNLLLEPLKVAALIVVSNELLRDVSAAGQQLFNRELMAAVSDAVDGAFFSMIASSDTTSIASSGSTALDAKTDARAALMAVNTVGAARLYWVCAPDVAKAASVLPTTDGGDAFPAMSAQGGEMANLPVVVSSGVPPGSLYLIDAAGIAADGGPVTVSASGQADVLMDSAPVMSSDVPTPATMTSMWQTNSTAMKANAWFAAQLLRDDAVAEVTSIDWGGA